MATIHLIWWGGFRDYDSCLKTANDISLSCTSHTVNLWVRASEVTSFQKANVNSAVNLTGLDSFEKIAGSRTDVLQDDYFKWAVEVLQVLDKYNCYAAVKDLMNLLILYLHGGLCIDTTARLLSSGLIDKHQGSSLNDALGKLGSDPKLPKISNDVWVHQPGVMTPIAILTGIDRQSGLEYEELTVKVPAIDVWMMYAPAAGLPAFKLMIESYLSRADRLGVNLSEDGSSLSPQFKDIGALLMRNVKQNPYNEKDRLARNELIGSLVVHSVYDGICSNYESDKFFKDFLWDTVKISDKKHYLVPSMGIEKIYANSWRSL